MKKYNTPEMKVSMFSVESITAAEPISGDWATFNAFTQEKGITAQEINWGSIEFTY